MNTNIGGLVKSKLSSFWLIVAGFMIWRTLLFLISIVADNFLPYDPSFPYSVDILAQYDLPRWIYSFANFDGVHYITIVEKGYVGTGLIQAFFPIYPLIVWAGTGLTLSPIVSGLIISGLFSLLASYLFVKLAGLDLSSKSSLWSVAALAVFPTAFFLASMYSESLFITLVLGAFLAARSGKWLLAGIISAVASASRVVGIALLPALILELIIQTQVLSQLSNQRNLNKQLSVVFNWLKQHSSQLIFCFIGAFGILSFMTYLQLEFNDPLYFLHVQSEFGAGRSEKLVLYPQVVWRAIKILFTYRPIDFKYWAFIQEAVVGIGGMALLLAGFRRIRPSYWLFSFFAFLIPTLTGTFSSMPRYVLVCFPLFMWLGQLISKNQTTRFFYLVISGTLLIINTILFVQGYWIA